MPASHYPPGWKAFSDTIRFGRANGQCECTGECGLHKRFTGGRRCIERHGQKAHFAKGRVILTVAHLCKCSPICMNPDHVKAMCQRCHLRVDRFKHAATRKARQQANL
jgi:hypothetical protein